MGAQVEYLTKVVSKMIGIDSKENRYHELANADTVLYSLRLAGNF